MNPELTASLIAAVIGLTAALNRWIDSRERAKGHKRTRKTDRNPTE